MSQTVKRVAFLTTEYGDLIAGGMGAVVNALVHTLDREHFEPVVVLPRSGYEPPWKHVARRQYKYCHADVYRDGPCEVWLLDNEILNEAPIYPAPFDYACMRKYDEFGERMVDHRGLDEFLDQNFFDLAELSRQPQLLRDLEADVLHLQEFFAYKALAGARFLQLPSIMTVHKLHDDFMWGQALAETSAMCHVDTTVTVSEGYLREHRSAFRGADVRAICNGVDLSAWTEDDLPRAERRQQLCERLGLSDRVTFASVGRIDTAQKAIDVLIAAYRTMQGPRPNLVFMGSGIPNTCDMIHQLAADFPDRVHFEHRMCGRDEVLHTFQSVDGALIPSRDEPFGLTQLESMAVGALPVVSRCGGLSDVVVDLDEDDDGFGKFAVPGNIESLARAMERMVEVVSQSTASLDALRERARRRAAEFSVERMTRSYEDLYREVIRRNAERRSR